MVMELPGALAYGETKERAMRSAEALALALALALRIIADRLDHGEVEGDFASISFIAA